MVDKLATLKRFTLKKVPHDAGSRQERLWSVLLVCAVKILACKGGLGALDQGNSVLHKSDLFYLRLVLAELVDRLVFVLDEDTKTIETVKSTEHLLGGDYLSRLWHNFSDKRLDGYFEDELSLGYIYQFFATPERRKSQNDIETADKSLTLDQLISFTQLYTPRWVVDFLLQNTLLSQWAPVNLNGHRWHYRVNGFDSQEKKDAGRLRLLDPACGSGHFLLPAVDLLLSLYQCEGAGQEEAIECILQSNLYGVDIDTTALAVAKLSLLVKCLNLGVNKNILFSGLMATASDDGQADLLGSLKRDWSSNHALSFKYDAVVMNPPYIGRKLLDRKLKTELKSLYPDAYSDLCAAFVLRGMELLHPSGRVGFIGQSSLLYLASYERLRKYLAESASVVSVVDAGLGVFPWQAGEKVNSVLMVAQAKDNGIPAKMNGNGPATDIEARFIDLRGLTDKSTSLQNLISESGINQDLLSGAMTPSSNVYLSYVKDFQYHRNYSYNYRCPQAAVKLMQALPALSSAAEIRQGLATTDNSRFVRLWWDVDPASIGKRWFPYVKGAGGEPWMSPIRTVVDWQDNGQAIKQAVTEAYPYLNGKVDWVVKNEQYYFRPGLTFSFVNSGQFAVRMLPPGCIFDVSGSSLFFKDDGQLYIWLAYLNSALVAAFAQVLNPTINFQVGDLKHIPVIPIKNEVKEKLAALARKCYELMNQLNSFDPSGFGYQRASEIQAVFSGADLASIWQSHKATRKSSITQLQECELQINELIEQALYQFADSIQITGAAKSELRDWLLRAKSRSARQWPGPVSEEQFARYVLCEVIANAAPLSLSLSDDALADLALTKQNVRWLEHWLQAPIVNYLQSKFAFDQRKFFDRSPRYFCLPNHQSLHIFSTDHLRQGNFQGANNQGFDALARLNAWAKNANDWRGADLARVVDGK
jgi:hypothetical protein